MEERLFDLRFDFEEQEVLVPILDSKIASCINKHDGNLADFFKCIKKKVYSDEIYVFHISELQEICSIALEFISKSKSEYDNDLCLRVINRCNKYIIW